ncbi:MAG: ABC transporter ATP-binding protein [Actinomycetota bacterium]|nr:ABC transporter ATP-binding protein [Actinomycetota bacterium]
MSSPILQLEGLKVSFSVPGGTVNAVRDVNLEVGKGEILGLVGETGSGKTTVGKAVVRLIEPTSGKVLIDGVDISHLSRGRMRPFRRKVQMVFQDPYSSLNPRMTVAKLIEHPLAIHGVANRLERRAKVEEIVDRVGLSRAVLHRYPGEMSGGQRQRVGLARALVLSPELLVADEPVSALDVSVQAGILNLLVDLQQEMGFSCLFITHDLSVAEHLCDRVAVMYLGEIVEVGSRSDVLVSGLHPYTQSLLEAVPVPDPVVQRGRVRATLPGDPPDPLNPPHGCALSPRCPLVDSRCIDEHPALLSYTSGQGGKVGSEIGLDHLIRCHRVAERKATSLVENTL